MPLWRMVSEKYYNGEFWSNTYVIQAADLATAVATGQNIRDVEKGAHFDTVAFTKFRVSDIVEETDVYQVVTENDTGELTSSGNQFLPLFNRVRVDFNTVGGGRPSRKYICPPIPEAGQNNGQLDLAYMSFINTYISGMLLIDGYVDVDGQAFSSGSATVKVGMRQLRRGSKRKLLPIVP